MLAMFDTLSVVIARKYSKYSTHICLSVTLKSISQTLPPFLSQQSVRENQRSNMPDHQLK